MTFDAAQRALNRVTMALPGAEERAGQQEMARVVAEAVDSERHVVVQAGTGTGKTLGYLVPVLIGGKRTVVATATKALQDQLASKDLPWLAEHLGIDVHWAVLKGRSNYLCMQRVRELQRADAAAQLELETFAVTTQAEIRRLTDWAAIAATGDVADLDWAPSERAWQAVSVGGDECPGAARCPVGALCFAEAARDRASSADVIVVNLHLYGLDLAAGGDVIVPEHEVVVIDEAHQLEDIMSDTVGIEVGPGSLMRLAATLRRALDAPELVGSVVDAATTLKATLVALHGQRLPVPLPSELHEVLVSTRLGLNGTQSTLRAIDTDVDEARQRVARAQVLTTRVQEHLDIAIGELKGYVPYVTGNPESPKLAIAPLDVAPVLSDRLWGKKRTAVLCSATVPSSLVQRVGLPADRTTVVDVGSPFDYQANAMLYCARHLPSPKSPQFSAAMHDELATLIDAAGGRTLALFTSWRAMEAAADALRGRLGVAVLTQRDLPKQALVRAFSDDETSCLFATAGFFQGIDVPGRTLSLVTIDRLPFPRPDDPLLSARRELLGPAAFATIDVPRASMLLAQATGRLIRTSRDQGVVAVFDRRLSTARYGWDIVNALPPMRRTRHRHEAEAFLRSVLQTDQR